MIDLVGARYPYKCVHVCLRVCCLHVMSQNCTLTNVDQYESGEQVREQLERHLKRLLPSIYRLADLPATHPNRRSAIYAQCKKLQSALNQLLVECGSDSDKDIQVSD